MLPVGFNLTSFLKLQSVIMKYEVSSLSSNLVPSRGCLSNVRAHYLSGVTVISLLLECALLPQLECSLPRPKECGST